MASHRRPTLGVLLFALASGAPAATIVVTDEGDALHSPGCATTGTGTCTLRDAITFANAHPGTDAIHFAIPGSGVHTIAPTIALPSLSDPVTIDGYTQAGAQPNTLAYGTNAVLKIVISSVNLTGYSALSFNSNDSTVRGLVLNNGFYYTISSGSGMSGNKVAGCFIGTDAAGAAPAPNRWGMYLAGSITVGGTAPADRNLISGNTSYEVVLDGVNGAVLQGNLIGTNAAGDAVFGSPGNTPGIAVGNVTNGVLIGGTAAGAGNVIGGQYIALSVSGIASGTALIQGNWIGTNPAGQNLGNRAYGADLFGSVGGSIVFGGTAPGAGNVVAFTDGNGVVVSGNAPVEIRGNSIFENRKGQVGFGYDQGIDLNNDGITANDPGDGDAGPNGLQNYPVLANVVSSPVQGTLNSAPNTTYALDFFANPTCGPNGYGQGKTYLGSADVTTNASGNGTFSVPLTIPAGQKVTATATAPDGSTSEFSRCADLLPQFLEADPTFGAGSDGDGVFEPGESAIVRPVWRNPTSLALTPVTATASAPGGPAGASYQLPDAVSDYGSIGANSAGSCATTSNCFSVFVNDPAARPTQHWDAHFTETLSTREGAKVWKLHIGNSFTDVSRSQLFYKKIETVFHNAITVGCTATNYCPDANVARDQMAIFLARGIAHGGVNVPVSGSVGGKPYNCVAGGISLFSDVLPTSIGCKSIHYIAAQNVTTGCQTGIYCPAQNVSRAQMAIFVAKGIVAPAGGAGVPLTYTDPDSHLSYSCDPASPNLIFSDVSTSDAFCKHVHFLYAKQVIAGCAGNMYCPNNGVTRGEMAKFLSNAFNLLLYGP